jgi:hypothetical protein
LVSLRMLENAADRVGGAGPQAGRQRPDRLHELAPMHSFIVAGRRPALRLQ